ARPAPAIPHRRRSLRVHHLGVRAVVRARADGLRPLARLGRDATGLRHRAGGVERRGDAPRVRARRAQLWRRARPAGRYRIPRVSPSELAYIHSDPPEPTGRVRWRLLLTHPQTWGFALGKFLTDPIWSFYLFWGATFLRDRHGVDLKNVGPPLIVVYVMADVGS